MSTDASSYLTTTTTFSSAKRTLWQAQLLQKIEERLVAEKFAMRGNVSKNEAGTLRWNKILRPAKKTTLDVEGTLYGYADAQKLTSNYVEMTPVELGESFVFSDDVDIEAMITNSDTQDEIANHFARSVEYQLQKTIATQSLWHRVDNDTTYEVSGTCDSGSSATVLKDDALTQADAFWDGAHATITNPGGPAYDETSAVSSWTASSDSGTVAFTNALTTASKYHLTHTATIAATDVLSTAALLRVRGMHQLLNNPTFEGGLMRGFIDAETEMDLWSDTTWADTAKYDDSSRYHNYKLIRWLGNEFMIGDELYRMSAADGAEDVDDGVVRATPIFGPNAYSVYRWGMGSGTFGMKWEIKDQPDITDLRNKVRALSWKCKFASKVLRSTRIITLLHGATSLNLLAT